MDKIVNRFNDLKKQVKVSDETVALILVAEKLDVIANKASILDPEQFVELKKKMQEIALSLHGVGKMVDKSQQ